MPIPRRAGLHHTQWLLGRTDTVTLNVPPSFLPSSPSFPCCTWCHILRDMPVVSWAQVSQLCPLTTSCAPPQPTGRWSDTRCRTGLFSAQIQNIPILATVKKSELYPQTSKEVQFLLCHSDLSLSSRVRRVEQQ